MSGSFNLSNIHKKPEVLNKRYESQIEMEFEDWADANNNALITNIILDLPVLF